MKILVTGANGYIGAKVIQKLCDKGEEVIATDLSNEHIDLRAKFIKADIFSIQDNWFDFFTKPDVCLHLAWRDGFVHNSKKHMLDLSHHFNFLTNLIDGGLKQLVGMGTMHEIGYWNGVVNEKTPCSPLSLYGVAKNSLRKAMEIYCESKNCIFQWLRAFYIYGNDSYGNSIFCKIRKAAIEGKKTFPFTKGENKCDFIDANELANQISATICQKKITGIINVCSGKPIKLSEKIEEYILKNRLSIKLEYGKYPERPYDSPCIFGDTQKIERILGGKK